VSRNGRELRRFRPLADNLAHTLKCDSAILDGEIVVKDATGRPFFIDLLKRRSDASYVALDVLWLKARICGDCRSSSASERFAG
jgi:ATP-dependent DNA ligase